ncbi:unnamed protein product [Paramecium sonneborni]|uniref:Transmembrane protein n=1 Tax=Paramecium sonneborni TaxID=65129 RepID=A0A8S1RIS1_9CILI|nr:unnamed protein product [Paramecium sonneborni]
MGNQNARIDDSNPQPNFTIQHNPYAIQQNTINSNTNQILSPEEFQQQNIQIANQQQSPDLQAQLIQQGIPIVQTFEIAQIPQQLISNQLKDQPFKIQKQEILKALIMYLVIQVISFILFFWLYMKFSKQTQSVQINLPDWWTIIIVHLLVIISGKFQFFQKNSIAIIRTLIILMNLCLFNAKAFFFNQQYSSFNENQQIEALQLLIVILITILYINSEQIEISLKKYYKILLPCLLIGFVTIFFNIFLIIIVFFSGTILLIVLRQLMNGRFQLQKGQTFGICNAIFLGLLVPCNIC